MWLLNAKSHELKLFRSNQPTYAILSHTWEDGGEVSFEDVTSRRHASRPGWSKIEHSCRQAIIDNIDWVWADTCCIDKRNAVEYEKAINSMFKWYHSADQCYVYLSDVELDAQNDEITAIAESTEESNPVEELQLQITGSRWFTRGWTLQELLAPKMLTFYDKHWRELGTREEYDSQIQTHTKIPIDALMAFRTDDYCAAEKLSWAVGRETTEQEDRAYSLLGIMDVPLGLIQGEGGERAFRRLQEVILRETNDTSILAWNKEIVAERPHWLLAPSPDAFEGCHIFKRYQSCSKGVLLDKTALSGTFDVYRDCFDVRVACLGHFTPVDNDNIAVEFQDGRPSATRDAVGVTFVEDEIKGTQRVLLDGKQCLLHSLCSQQGLTYYPAQKLAFNPSSAMMRKRNSSRALSPHFPLRGKPESPVRIVPGMLWPPGEAAKRDANRLMYLGGPKSGQMEPDRKLYLPLGPGSLKSIIMKPGSQHNARCFVIRSPACHDNGFVVHFWYDTTCRPTARIDHIRGSWTDFNPLVDLFRNIESDAERIEICSQNRYPSVLTASRTEAKQWANSVAFDELVEPNNLPAPVSTTDENIDVAAVDGIEFANEVLPPVKPTTCLPSGSRILELGDDIKIVFVPHGDSGHRSFLSFRGNFDDLSFFPREWLWPVPETKPTAVKPSKGVVKKPGLASRLKGLLQ